jgi:hypothetical protein
VSKFNQTKIQVALAHAHKPKSRQGSKIRIKEDFELIEYAKNAENLASYSTIARKPH